MKALMLLLLFLLSFCSMAQQIDIQGHRGCRGLMPENTIAAFFKAIDLGVTTLEMDVVISKDHQVVLSHEPFLNHEICSGPKGETLDTLNEQSFNLYHMNYEEICLCDCGSKTHPRFPEQKKLKAFKPLLESVIDTVERYIAYKKLKPVHYNIEIKSTPETDHLYHPEPSVYVDLVYDVIHQKKISSRVILQSFDPRVLNEIYSKQLPVRTAFLIENTDGFSKNMALLKFTPTIYSPDKALVNGQLLKECKKRHMLLIPWTVNEPKEIRTLLKLGVDGLISDYPDRVMEELKKF
jgi:glycerophosphoryl diester phosphodiesterase